MELSFVKSIVFVIGVVLERNVVELAKICACWL